MTKSEAIRTLTENGVFELTQEILDTLSADKDPAHEAANRNIADLIGRVHQMSNWMQFGWKEMVDLAAQAYGFVKYLGYSEIDACADVLEQLEDLHTIIWSNFSSMEVWNG